MKRPDRYYSSPQVQPISHLDESTFLVLKLLTNPEREVALDYI
jgi:hypothetical protein